MSLLCGSVTPVFHSSSQFIVVSVTFWNDNTWVGLVTGNGGACYMLSRCTIGLRTINF